MTDLTLSRRFSATILSASEAALFNDCTLGGSLTLFEKGKLSCSYSPFEFVNSHARIVLVGITPGRRQATDALIAYRRSMQKALDEETALAVAKSTASFAGAMRSNLIRMFDHVGLHTHLQIPSCADLFGSAQTLVHYTSALRNPVFVDGANYSGQPKITAVPELQEMVRRTFFDEIRKVSSALWVPLGASAELALQMAVDVDLLNRNAVLTGFPHASGANAERIAYFLGIKQRKALSSKTNPDIIDRRKDGLMRALAQMAGSQQPA
ncbi:hypothetical protein IB279_34135 [Ensifer sp. ENS06]|uniref:hypothetical protein n=1 Tax=Ensifer sp. ENS06 TaxID=2769276 RepID=UPI00177D7055|nr:hypothetical protein [Ensifer sp. ENS06]MBD9627995.1 hypothetical protein [Ensifer sp. ENS06]